MMNRIKINEKTFNLLASTAQYEELSGHIREVVTLLVEASYNDAIDNFVRDSSFTIIEEVIGEDGMVTTVEHFHDDYPTSGPITDNRDGTVVVKMGAANTAEQDALEAKNEAEKQTQKVSMNLVILAGKSLSGESNEISELRKSFEAACSKLSDADMLIAPSLAPSWDIGQNIAQGERRYYRPNDTLHKALKPHVSSFENGPGNTEYWEEV